MRDSVVYLKPILECIDAVLLDYILVHDYPGVDLDIAWNVVENELSALQRVVTDYLRKNHD